MEAWVETWYPAGNSEARGCLIDAARTAERGQGMVGELQGVPKPALQTVFGKALGRRIWDYARRLGEGRAGSQATSEGHGNRGSVESVVTDGEILGGMIDYVSRQAGETLRQSRREAKAIGLRLVYADGVATLDRMRLARPTSDGRELSEAAVELFRRSRAREGVVDRVDLKVTSVAAESVRETPGSLEYGMAGAMGARA
jgi:nucleotidyltransferase/DNA polymerase involved in DNA repair